MYFQLTTTDTNRILTQDLMNMLKKNIAVLIGILAGYLVLITIAFYMGLASEELVFILGLGLLSTLPLLLQNENKKKRCNPAKVKQISL